MDVNNEKAKREGGIDVGDLTGGRDVNIHMEHVAGRDIVTSYHYYGIGPERKDEAEARPLVWPDGLPEVGDLPVGSWGVPDRNDLFVGREEELREVAGILCEGKTAVITGMGGLGKSQLATMFAYRYGPLFSGGVFWVSMANSDAIEANIALCGGIEGMNLLSHFETLAFPDQVALVRRAWQQPIPRLLIFDNCEEERFLKEFRPNSDSCKVIVTSRRGVWTPGMRVQMVALKPLTAGQSIELLQRHVPQAAAAELGAIAHEVAGLPLALDLAGRFLHKYRQVTAELYLTLWRKEGVLNHPALQGRGVDTALSGHLPHVSKTLELSYERLLYPDPTNELAKRLLTCAAWFAPGEPIPLALVEQAAGLWGEESEGGENPTENLLRQAEAEEKLVALGLWQEMGEAAVKLHQLMVAYVQGLAGTNEALPAVEKAVGQEARRIVETGNPGPLLRWQGHLQAITDRAVGREDTGAADLAEVLADHLCVVGAYEAAQPYTEKSLVVRQVLLGPDHPDTARSLNSQGNLFRATGRYQEAKPYYEQALAIRERVQGGKHLDTAESLNDLAGLLRVMGNYAGARPLYERSLAIREQVLGAEHPDTAESLNNLGTLLQAVGNLAGARPLLERSLVIKEQVLGAEHPSIATSLNNLAGLLRAMGDLVGARPLYVRSLQISEPVLGAEHPDTATSLNNLGLLLQAMGDLAGARPLLERSLRIRGQVLGAEHPDTTNSLNNLGLLLKTMGDLDGARPLLERSLRIKEQVLGAEHPSTATGLNNLGLLLQAMGDLEGARPLLERSLRISEQVLGVEHPNTKIVWENLERLKEMMKDKGEEGNWWGWLTHRSRRRERGRGQRGE